MHIHDFHATVLAAMGLDHQKLTFKYSGRDFRLTDTAGNVDTVSKRVNIVAGPKVTVLTPIGGDSVPAGVALTLSVRATHPDGVASITINVQSQGAWPTPVNYSTTGNFPLGPKDTTWSGSFTVPLNAPVGGRLLFTASGIVEDRRPHHLVADADKVHDGPSRVA